MMQFGEVEDWLLGLTTKFRGLEGFCTVNVKRIGNKDILAQILRQLHRFLNLHHKSNWLSNYTH